ncbi:CinA family protein [Microbacterium awajiense]|uniref:CinA family protein n=1 Tax=Microbacterium awajiense TaxID=415214 RepID=UPI0031CE1340
MNTPAAPLTRVSQTALRDGVLIALAESLTSGLLASRVGAAPDASSWFAGGVVAYRTAVKEDLLGLPPGTDPCSAECAEQLARGVRTLLAADVSISTTGVGGPDPQDGHPPGTVYLGWATSTGSGHRLLRIDGPPETVVETTVAEALALLDGVLSR